MLNITIDNTVLIAIAIVMVVLILGVVIYIFLQDKKQDKEEIEEILQDRMKQDINVGENICKKSEIEEVLEKMQQDLETKTEDIVETFEKEQEEKSIISYQELLKTLQKEENPTITTIEKKEMPKLNEVVKPLEVETLKEQPTTLVKQLKTSEAVRKFKNTDFISPVYGKMEEHLEYPTVPSFHHQEHFLCDHSDEIEDAFTSFDQKLESHNIDDYLEDFNFDNHMKIDNLEQTLDMPPISPEVKKNEDFLQALKEFRKNLE